MKKITFLIISLAVVISAPKKSQGQNVDELRDSIIGGAEIVGLAPPPPQVPTLDLNHQQPSETEEKTIIRWRNVSGADGFRLYRRMHQVVATSAYSLPKSLEPVFNPLVWHEVYTSQTAGQVGNNYSYTDPLPEVNGNLPINQRRQFGMARCYKVEAFNQYGSSESSVVCRAKRGINTPNGGSSSATQTSITVNWGDRSALEEGYKVYYRRQANETEENVIITRGENYEGPVVIRGLDPDTQYRVRVVAYDYFGESAPASKVGVSIITTLPVPPTEPMNKTAHVTLNRQPVYEGPIPYLGSFPIFGIVSSDNVLKKIQILNQWPSLLFVKNGHSTAECLDPNAVVEIASGAETTTANLEELFGTSTPSFPLMFLACKIATGGPLERVMHF